MNISNAIKLKVIKNISPIFIVGNIVIIHYLFIYKNKNTCNELAINGLSSIFIVLSILHILAVFRIWVCCLTIDENYINWSLLDGLRDNRLNIPQSIVIIQIIQGLIGFFDIMNINILYLNTSVCIDDRNFINYITFAFLPFIIISVVFYVKCIYILLLFICICICRHRTLNYINCVIFNNEAIDNQLDNITIDNHRIYYGNTPECSICYNQDCNILTCGHLLCNDCEYRILNQECPVCRSRLHVVQSYRDYKIKRDNLIKNILQDILNTIT